MFQKNDVLLHHKGELYIFDEYLPMGESRFDSPIIANLRCDCKVRFVTKLGGSLMRSPEVWWKDGRHVLTEMERKIRT